MMCVHSRDETMLQYIYQYTLLQYLLLQYLLLQYALRKIYINILQYIAVLVVFEVVSMYLIVTLQKLLDLL